MIYRIFIGLILTLALASPAMAREAHFSPALGDVFDGADGPERAVVTEDGTLGLFSYQGDSIDNFPLFVENQVVVS